MITKVFGQMIATQIISSMTVMLCMLVDNIMIGRYLGVESMTAYGFSTPVLLVFAALGSMLSAGIQVVCGKTMGVGDQRGTNRCFSTSAAVTFAISAVGVLVVILFTSPLCTLIGAGENVPGNTVFGLTKDYLRGFIIGAPAFMFAQIMVPYMQISGSRTRLVTAVVAMTIADIGFDILNVFVLKWGTFGMGLASSLSYYIAFFIGLGYFFKKDCLFHFKRKLVRMPTLGKIFKAGIPTLVNQITLVLLTLALNKLLDYKSGHAAVAAYTAISTTGNICYSFSTGPAAVALTLSSMLYSDEDRSSLCKLVKTMIYHGTIICAVVTAVVLMSAKPMVSLFSENPEVRNIASRGMRLFVLSLIPCAINTAFKNYYQGIDRSRLTEFISLMQNFTFPVLSALVLSSFLGLKGIWLGFLCGEIITLIVITVIVNVKNGKFSLSAAAFAMLPKDFGAPEEDCFELQIVSEEQIIPASQAAQDFCTMQGLDNHTGKLISLLLEELSYNIVKYGFTKGKDENLIEMRIVVSEGKPTLRILDNCANFDPVDYLKMHSDDDPTAHIGLKMIMKLVSSANYINSLGLNFLTLKL